MGGNKYRRFLPNRSDSLWYSGIELLRRKVMAQYTGTGLSVICSEAARVKTEIELAQKTRVSQLSMDTCLIRAARA